MATGTLPPNAKGDSRAVPSPAETAAYVERRIHETRRNVKGVDIAGGLMSLAVGGLAYLLVGAVIDQWLMPGGLGFWGRFLLLAGLLGGGGWYFSRTVLPSLLYRINPIFAAATIERSRPTLKNSLINFLLLRGHREVPAVVYQALEQRAAIDLSQVHVETAVDRRPVIRLGYVLAGVLAAFCLYLVLSPKSTVASVTRILWPWASTQAPTRVTFDDVEPGDDARPQGALVTVKANVRGLRTDEPVTLIYSTADGQVVEQAIPMTWSESDRRYTAKLPPGKLGLQQDYTYRLTAGDCTTPTYRLEVQLALSIGVDAVDYVYPPYTKLENRTLEHLGDLRGIDGTEATIRATANQPIGRAEIDLDGNGRHPLKMRVSGEKKAAGTLALRLTADDPPRAEHESYQLRFTDREGRKNGTPSRYSIEVIADQKPEVEVLAPQEVEIQVPLDGQVEIRVRAKDPDFALRKVALRAKREGDARELTLPPLLDLPAPKEPHAGEFAGSFIFKPGEQPKEVKLAKGDRIAYWAEADDNREEKKDFSQWTPAPNRTATGKRYIVIVEPQAQEKPKPNDDGKKQPTPAAKTKNNPGNSKPGDPGESGTGGEAPKTDENPADGNPGEAASKPGQNPQSKPGDSPEHANGQENPQPDGTMEQNGQPGEAKPGDKPSSDGAKPGQPGDSGDKTGDKSAGQRPEPVALEDEGKAVETINNDRKEQEKQKGDQQQKPDGDQPEQKPGGGQPEQKPGGGQPEQKPGGGQPEQKPGGGQPEQKPGGGQPEQKPGGGQPEQKPGGGQPEQKPGGGQPEQKPGGGQPEQKPGGGQPEQKPGGGQPEQKPGGGQPEQKPGGGQPEQKPGGGQPEQKPGGGQPEQKPGGGQPEQKPGGGQPEQKPGGGQPEQKPGGGQPEQKPDGGVSAKKPGTGEADQKPDAGQPKQKPGEGKLEDKTGSEPKIEQSPPGSGMKSGDDNKGGPENEADNQPKSKQKPGEAGKDESPDKSDSVQSPTTSPKQSSSKGDTEGDRSGGGKPGGGQRNPNAGTGAAGANSPADSGGSKSKQKGSGETGKGPGEEVESDKFTGGEKTIRSEGGSGRGTPEASDKIGGKELPKDTPTPGGEEKPAKPDGGAAGKDTADRRGTSGQGTPTAGGAPPEKEEPTLPFTPNEPGGDDPNLKDALKQTNLALEHLKDQLAKEKPELLDRLGWTPDEARRFIEKWERLQRAATQPDARGKSAKRELDDALKSLGLRRGTELKGGSTGRDKLRDMREAGRAAPPPDWAEAVREYQRGVAEGGK